MLSNPSFFPCSSSCLWIFALSFVPSLLWLVLFWLQDKHPEPKRLILHTFFWGMLVAIPVIVLEGVAHVFARPMLEAIGVAWIYGFAGVALVEEAAKYAVVRIKALPLRDFNEPQDAVLYMVAAALGFAAVENFSFALEAYHTEGLYSSFMALGVRTITSTLLHVVASGLVGVLLAISYFPVLRAAGRTLPEWESPPIPLLQGLALATLLHGFYNYFIMEIEEGPLLWDVIPLIPILILLGGGIILGILYRRLRSSSV